MADKPVTDLVKAESAEMAQADMVRPDFIHVGDRSGTEHLTREDIQMPRMGLAQQMSPELVEGDAKFIEDLKLGNLFNSLTRVNYGNGPLQFCIIRADPPRWVEFAPREAGGGIVDPNVPANDPRTLFGPRTPQFPNGTPPVATKFYDFIVMLLPSRELIALSFKSTGLKIAKQLNGLMAGRNAAIFTGKYSLMSTMVQNTKGRFATFIVKNAGWLQDKDTHDYAQNLFQSMRDKTVHIDRDNPNDDPDTFDVAALERDSVDVGTGNPERM